MSRKERWLETHDKTVSPFLGDHSKRAVDVVRALNPHTDKLHSHRSGGNLRLFAKTSSAPPPAVPKMATRLSLGVISFSSSKSFPPNSPPTFVSPVTFPPGRARLATSPVATGSVLLVMTMGIVVVAFLR